MTAAKPPARQRAVGALASGFATAELHHQAGHDPGAALELQRSERFAPLHDWIRTHLTGDLGLAALAAQAAMSASAACFVTTPRLWA